jgi:hypothetical protein
MVPAVGLANAAPLGLSASAAPAPAEATGGFWTRCRRIDHRAWYTTRTDWCVCPDPAPRFGRTDGREFLTRAVDPNGMTVIPGPYGIIFAGEAL